MITNQDLENIDSALSIAYDAISAWEGYEIRFSVTGGEKGAFVFVICENAVDFDYLSSIGEWTTKFLKDKFNLSVLEGHIYDASDESWVYDGDGTDTPCYKMTLIFNKEG